MKLMKSCGMKMDRKIILMCHNLNNWTIHPKSKELIGGCLKRLSNEKVHNFYSS